MTKERWSLVAIDHVQLAMPRGRESAARGFYEGILGLSERPKPEALAARGGCWFETETVKIHLGVEEDFRPARKAHPAIQTADLDALQRRLEQAGISTRTDEALEGRRRFFADDPFGNRIEFLEPL
jgi:catechol 2,3-dioxygenase-like lactoylglutathione lyase family enzyme